MAHPDVPLFLSLASLAHTYRKHPHSPKNAWAKYSGVIFIINFRNCKLYYLYARAPECVCVYGGRWWCLVCLHLEHLTGMECIIRRRCACIWHARSKPSKSDNFSSVGDGKFVSGLKGGRNFAFKKGSLFRIFCVGGAKRELWM